MNKTRLPGWSLFYSLIISQSTLDPSNNDLSLPVPWSLAPRNSAEPQFLHGFKQLVIGLTQIEYYPYLL